MVQINNGQCLMCEEGVLLKLRCTLTLFLARQGMLLCVVASSTFYDMLVSLHAMYVSDSGKLLDHTVHEWAFRMTENRGNMS